VKFRMKKSLKGLLRGGGTTRIPSTLVRLYKSKMKSPEESHSVPSSTREKEGKGEAVESKFRMRTRNMVNPIKIRDESRSRVEESCIKISQQVQRLTS